MSETLMDYIARKKMELGWKKFLMKRNKTKNIKKGVSNGK